MTLSASPDSAACVSLRGVELAFGAQRVLQGLDWAMAPGQVVGLLGRNGAGKTTLIEALLGLRETDAGSALLFGQPVAGLDDDARARIGYVPQRSDLFEWLTPAQLLAYFRSFYPRWNAAKVDALMSRWDIARDKPIAQLSGGQQQRLSIVRALAHEPALLVLDEPVASLDPAGRRDFLRELVEQVVDGGTTVLFSTHILSDLERIALDVAFLVGGRIALQAPLDELLECSVRLAGPADEVRRFVQANRLETLTPPSSPVVIARCAAGAPPLSSSPAVGAEPVTLEDLFIALA